LRQTGDQENVEHFKYQASERSRGRRRWESQ
jgi:hypothetical protein